MKRVVYDDFRAGFDPYSPDARWQYFGAGSYLGNGGVEVASPEGLHVVANGVNPCTGEPMFTNTLAQEQDNENDDALPGGLDHVKWLVYSTKRSRSGLPGFDCPPGEELVFDTYLGGRTYGTEAHPFGEGVLDPADDMRLAAFAMSTIDVETFMVFDFFLTNETIYAFYERLPYARPKRGNYASFSFAVPVGANQPHRINHLKIAYDRDKNRVRWELNGSEVLRIDRVGRRIDRRYMTLDHGGTDEEVRLDRLNPGMGLFTLMDGSQPSGLGLARLSSSTNFYYDPRTGEPTHQEFVDAASEPASRLFGQGAELRVREYGVCTAPSRD